MTEHSDSSDPLPHGVRFWEDAYAGHEAGWFFGDEPSTLARRVAHFLRVTDIRPGGRLLDIGCGEGRDIVFFATAGFEVEAIDGSPTAVSRARRAVNAAGLNAVVSEGDLASFSFRGEYDVIFANNSIQFAGVTALGVIRAIRAHTRPGGLNAIGMFTREESGGEREPDTYLLERNELRRLYPDWQLLEYGESVVYAPRRGIHRSFANLITRRPSGAS